LYSWYSPRQRADLTVKECAFDRDYKLYRSGEFFDLRSDPDETKPLPVAQLSGQAAQAAAKLQGALDQYAEARPAELDQQFLASRAATPQPAKRPNRKAKAKAAE
jgi:arylsulfatase A